MRLGIIGARDYPTIERVERFVRGLPKDTVVISGGAIGVDTVAARTARECGLEVVEYLPNLNGCVKYHDFCDAYYARNKLIVNDSDQIVAFTHRRSGGTMHTVRYAESVGKKATLIYDHEPNPNIRSGKSKCPTNSPKKS